MKKLIFTFLPIFLLFGTCLPASSSDAQLEKYIAEFDYAARKEMKIDALVQLKP